MFSLHDDNSRDRRLAATVEATVGVDGTPGRPVRAIFNPLISATSLSPGFAETLGEVDLVYDPARRVHRSAPGTTVNVTIDGLVTTIRLDTVRVEDGQPYPLVLGRDVAAQLGDITIRPAEIILTDPSTRSGPVAYGSWTAERADEVSAVLTAAPASAFTALERSYPALAGRGPPGVRVVVFDGRLPGVIAFGWFERDVVVIPAVTAAEIDGHLAAGRLGAGDWQALLSHEREFHLPGGRHVRHTAAEHEAHAAPIAQAFRAARNDVGAAAATTPAVGAGQGSAGRAARRPAGGWKRGVSALFGQCTPTWPSVEQYAAKRVWVRRPPGHG